MEDLRNWLCANGLGDYFPALQKHGWDEMSLLNEMTDLQIEKCIPKAGHRAKFKGALRHLCLESNSSVTNTPKQDLPGVKKSVIYDRRQPIPKPDQYAGRVSTFLSKGHRLPLTQVEGKHKPVTMIKPGTQESHCIVKLNTWSSANDAKAKRNDENAASYSRSSVVLPTDSEVVTAHTS